MNDNELADKVVALGVEYNNPVLMLQGQQAYAEFLSDWRVAGALIQKCSELHINCHKDQDMCPTVTARSWHGEEATVSNWNRCKAIIESCVEALENEM